MLCAFFKAGSCCKGDKGKFAHDLNVARKGEKRNVYENEEKDGKESFIQHAFHVSIKWSFQWALETLGKDDKQFKTNE